MRFGFTDQQSKKLKDLDHDKSNSLNVDEFVLYYYSTQHRFNYTAVGIIDTHDADHDKKLTRVELQSVEHGVPMVLLRVLGLRIPVSCIACGTLAHFCKCERRDCCSLWRQWTFTVALRRTTSSNANHNASTNKVFGIQPFDSFGRTHILLLRSIFR